MFPYHSRIIPRSFPKKPCGRDMQKPSIISILWKTSRIYISSTVLLRACLEPPETLQLPQDVEEAHIMLHAHVPHPSSTQMRGTSRWRLSPETQPSIRPTSHTPISSTTASHQRLPQLSKNERSGRYEKNRASTIQNTRAHTHIHARRNSVKRRLLTTKPVTTRVAAQTSSITGRRTSFAHSSSCFDLRETRR